MRSVVVAALTSQMLSDLEPLPVAAWRAIKRLPESGILDFAKLRLPGKDFEAISRRLNRLDEFENELAKMSEAGIYFLTEFEPGYPEAWIAKFADRTPSHLFVAGNPDLLNSHLIGVVGSRNVDALGMAFSRSIARQAVQHGYGVISGGAKGVDEIAMKESLAAGGSTVGILADSLSRQMGKWDLESGSICLASPFAPNTGFQVGNAMARNKLIYAGSVATVVVASDLESGGTWAGAIEAIKNSLCPVMVRDAELPGNQALIAKGGQPIRETKELSTLVTTTQPIQSRLL